MGIVDFMKNKNLQPHNITKRQTDTNTYKVNKDVFRGGGGQNVTLK